MNWLEITAAALGVVTILLVVRRSVWNYPFGLVMVSLYFVVFWDAKLYSDALLQIFFFLIQLYGWWNWAHADQVDDGVAVQSMGTRARGNWVAVTITAGLAWGWLMHRYTDAAAPYVDALVAALSVAAQLLQSLRRYESWMFWIAVDLLATALYYWRGLGVTAMLYALFLAMAVAGYLEWRRRLPECR